MVLLAVSVVQDHCAGAIHISLKLLLSRLAICGTISVVITVMKVLHDERAKSAVPRSLQVANSGVATEWVQLHRVRSHPPGLLPSAD